jgi:hypothetical protein
MNIEQNAAETLLNKGIKVRVTAPLLFRLFGKATIGITITQPRLGTLYRISAVYLKAGIIDDDLPLINDANAHELFNKHGYWLAKVAAIAWLNNLWLGKVFTGIVTRWLYEHLTALQLLAIANVLAVLSGTQAFTNTIRLAASMKMTKPNLSQTNQGS